MGVHSPLLLDWLDAIALGYMFILWISYAQYAKHRAKQGDKQSLSHSMRLHRVRWVTQMLDRDMRVTDAALLASQERVVGFFASTTLILLAAVFTAVSTAVFAAVKLVFSTKVESFSEIESSAACKTSTDF